MEKKPLITKILYTIRNFFLIIFMTIANLFLTIIGAEKRTLKRIENEPIRKQNKEETKKTKDTYTEPTSLPDEDNIKTNLHTSNIQDTPVENEPITKLYKVYDKDNIIKYLTLNKMLDLLVKEELERTYKEENFKLKEASPKQLNEVEKIKERILPKIIDRIEKYDIENSDIIREETKEALIEDQLKNPLFPKKEITPEPYVIAFPRKKEIELNKKELPKIKKEETKKVSTEKKEIINKKLESNKIQMVKTTDEIKKPTQIDNIKEAATMGVLTAADIINEIITPTPEEKTEPKKDKQQDSTKEKHTDIQEEIIELKEVLKTEEIYTEVPVIEPELIKEIKEIEKKDKQELEQLKKQVEEKIEKIKEEQQKQEKIKKEEQKQEKIKKEEHIEDQKRDKDIIDVTEVSNNIIEDTHLELNKDDFFDKDYERIERQIDKMLDDITNTYLRYGDKLTDKQKRKLQAEEERLRTTKEQIRSQKSKDISIEQKSLDEIILESEKQGLQNELDKIHQENEQEVNNNLFERMNKLEGMTAEQIAAADKRILLKRFNKANLILEMTSLLALPFIRNKYFFYFTAGLIVDNHFNFVNAFFNRKYSKNEPADLSQIQRGQDALNGALDITYKNLVQLEYLEQRAITKYPELINDPRFVSQVTSLRTNLNKKYNKLMKKNNIMEKYRMKTKRQRKILKPKKKQQHPNEQEAA